MESENLEWVKKNLHTTWSTTKFCGMCLSHNQLIEVDSEIVLENHANSLSLLDIINYVFKENIGGRILSAYICRSCIEKAAQSYLFIHHTLNVQTVIEKCVDDIYSKAMDIDDQITQEFVSNKDVKVMIILEDYSSPYREFKFDNKQQSKKIAAEVNKKGNEETKTDIIKVKIQEKSKLMPKKYIGKVKTPNILMKNNKLILKPLTKTSSFSKPSCSIYKCTECLKFLPTYQALKKHEKDVHGKIEFACKECRKYYKTQQGLDCHYNKSHLKARCKICQNILPRNKLTEHLKENHENEVYPCDKCDRVFYSSEHHEKHIKINHFDSDLRISHCIMCLRDFYNSQQIENHNCKFNCPECPVLPEVKCIHYKYLLSYKKQVLRNVLNPKCLDCDFVVLRREYLLGHVNSVHLNHYPFICDYCGIKFHVKSSLKKHIARSHKEPFYCEFCDMISSDIQILEAHKKLCKQVMRKHKCSQCVASFDRQKQLSKHEILRHSELVYTCNYCEKRFSTVLQLEKHQDERHEKKTEQVHGNFECPLCNLRLNSLNKITDHQIDHDSGDLFPCKICSTELKSLKKLFIHIRQHKTISNTLKSHLNADIPVQSSLHICETCGKKFPLGSMLRFHQKSHLRPVPCPKCNKLIKPAGLNRHIRQSHSSLQKKPMNGRNLICQVCGHEMITHSQLEAHMNRFHLKIKPYVCHICNRAFCGERSYKEHLVTHTGNNIVCSICGQEFVSRASLKVHFRKHTGETPYCCDECGKKFRSSNLLKRHKLTTHNPRTVPCPICGSMFFIAREMRQHVKKVHWKHKNKAYDPHEIEGLTKEHYYLFEDSRCAIQK